MKPTRAYRVLIVCSGNLCRSPMAEGMLRHMLDPGLQDRVEIRSAGTYAQDGNPAAPFAVEAMSRLGIDIGDHRASRVTEKMLTEADLILTMEHHHGAMMLRSFPFGSSRIRLLCEFGPPNGHREVPDPYGLPLAAYVDCANIIGECLKGVAEFIHSELIDRPCH